MLVLPEGTSAKQLTGIIPAQALYGEYDFIFFGDNGQALDAIGCPWFTDTICFYGHWVILLHKGGRGWQSVALWALFSVWIAFKFHASCSKY